MLSVAPASGPDGQIQLHASSVVINGHALAITGPSGSGKSAFALALIGRGATLLADDITWLTASGPVLTATCPPMLSGRIEARGVGILRVSPADPAPLRAIVDLGAPEPDRLPDPHTTTLGGIDIRVFHTPAMAHFIDAILLYMSDDTAD